MTVTFKGDNALLGAGAPFEAFSYQALLGSADSKYDENSDSFTINVTSVKPLNMATVAAFLAAGGEVENLPVFIKMSTATYAGDVPAGISNRVDENDQTRKWSEWKDANHNHHDATDGDKIVPGNSWGVELTSNEITALLGATGNPYTLYLAHEITAHMESGE